jgi:hypothetical protein
MGWFINDHIHPNTQGELQLAQGIKQYIINGEIDNFMNISNMDLQQADTITPANSNITLELFVYSLINKNITTLYFEGNINFTTPITIDNLSDIIIGQITDSYMCGSAYGQGLDAYIEGYVWTPNDTYNNSNAIKVGFRIYNDNNNNIHLKSFTVSDDGGFRSLTISLISFPYGTLKFDINSKYC